MGRPVFIYTLSDPRDGRVRYVGKGVNPSDRFRNHLWGARNGRNTRKDCWIKSLLAIGLEPSIDIVFVSNETDWYEDEERFISQYPDLTNLSHRRGFNPPRTKEWIQKIADANRGKKFSPEICEAMRQRGIERHNAGCKNGHPWTEENTIHTKGPNSYRACRICRNMKLRERRIRLGLIKGRQRPFCKKGHPMSGENLRLMERASGRVERVCRACTTERNRKIKARKKIA